ncbi:MAG TPA: T9SS type A sorting domain-containing protein [Candidatus Eisenbacteria bacterium]|uniref:T9SS type A sorting domain-containing protein n=1 Tax=Eiseniibacteriota bacterium TaxID=2212470 RepID=A0A7V2AVZ4_UNCEI|nr:T9SS type A sorting domain-containing protein [Candidatus Eisenbacteria bacterium]
MIDRVKAVSVLVVLLLICTAGWASAEKRWVSIDGTAGPEAPKATVLRSSDTETVIRFDIRGFWLEEVTEDGIVYQRLSMPGYATTLDVGKPELPVISELVAIPARAGVRAQIIEQSEITFEGYRVYPFQKILKIGEKRTTFDLNQEFYGRSGMYPDAVEVGAPGIWRDLRVVDLRVAAARCNPASGELVAAASITVKLSYEGTSDVNVRKQAAGYVNTRHDAVYREAVLNYDDLDIPVLAAPPTGYDLLIIAEDRYVAAIDPLVNHKRQRGYKVNVVAVSTIGTTADAIKSFIQNEYINSGISYCLLVGEEYGGYIPYCDITGGQGDYPYSLLSGTDSYPEIGVGRFPASSETEVGTMVAKTIAYESNPPDGDWLSKSLLIAGTEEFALTDCEIIRDASLTESGLYYAEYPLDFETAYCDEGATTQDVIDHIHAGMWAVTYIGHGEESGWAFDYPNYGFGMSHIDQCENGEMTPLVFAIACLTARPSNKLPFFGSYFVRHEEGAVAYFGATVTTISFTSMLAQESYAGLYDRGISTISDATNAAIVEMILTWNAPEYADDYIWYGDPTLDATYEPDGPQAPELVSPEYGESFDAPAQVTLDWTDVGGVNGDMLTGYYHVQVASDPGFSTIVGEVNFVYSEWTTPELDQGIYYWRVQTFVYPDMGPWSEARHFFVGIDAAPCVLVSPADGAKFSAKIRSINFIWENVYNPGEYLLQLDDDPAFGSPREYTVSGTSCNVLMVMLLQYSKWYWRVRATNPGWPWSEVRSFRIQDSNKPDPDPRLSLTGNFPNPFNPSTRICFETAAAGRVKLEVFNVNGALIATLLDEVREAGSHEVLWNGKDTQGNSVASGVYFYRLEAGSAVTTKKMMLLR